MINQILKYVAIFFIFLFVSKLGFAQYIAKGQGIGQVAQNALEPVGFMSDFVHSACIVLGCSFLFASIIKYFEHRRSPLMPPMSTVVFLLIAGLVFLLLPFLPQLTEW